MPETDSVLQIFLGVRKRSVPSTDEINIAGTDVAWRSPGRETRSIGDAAAGLDQRLAIPGVHAQIGQRR